MHELAIAQRLIETATALLPTDAQNVSRLRIQLGALGVSEDELRFGIEVVAAETPCAGAQVDITHIPATAHCPQCGIDFAIAADEILACPACQSTATIVIQGKELLITSLEVNTKENTEVNAENNNETVYG